jgi:HD superfamily phosphohydrolase
MDTQKAKQQIHDFLGDTEITFSVTSHENGEWEAQFDQIAGLSVCGDATDNFDYLIRDAIVTAAGVGVEHIDMVK